MKLKTFQIQNYKSILDSGVCRLSDNDNITILAGQNESGKSAILQAIRDYENEELDIESLREDETRPKISCTFSIMQEDIGSDGLLPDIEIPSQIKELIGSIRELTITKSFDAQNKCIKSISDDLNQRFILLLESDNQRITENNIHIKTGEPPHEQPQAEWDIKDTITEIINELIRYTPKIIFFDDFCDLLPDQILLSDLKSKKAANGFQAVKNI
jgi:hypothetical protein